ncbi:hypothetical protein [Streptomyces inhibens]|uniref:hypothetical protein n=1 Tax=Streptomyces inhibens TaxID=2293571 RepID=UPI001EE74608|nr:hypothetical protein [Streptomyces inhibens]UKY48530.1 hypothetical protein KI385_06785 [Streptomyces inhibens]
MSSYALQRLAERDGIRVYSAKRIPGGWRVHLTYPSSKFEELGADPGDPICTPEWPCLTPHQPSAGGVLAEWFATIAGQGPETPPPQVVAALKQDLKHLLGDKYKEYKRA